MKDIEMMSDRELLEELVRAKRKEERSQKIRMILYIVLALAVIVAVGMLAQKVMGVVNRYNTVIEEMEAYREKISETLNIFSEEDVENFKKTMEDLKNILNFFNR